jgi:hypothetical protein
LKVSVTVNGLSGRPGRALADRLGETVRRALERRLRDGSRPAPSASVATIEPATAEPVRGER